VLEDGQTAAAIGPQEFFDTIPGCSAATWSLRWRSPYGDRWEQVIAGLENVHVSLENNPILHGIDLHVRQGELLAIMGPNGSGKTTAMLTLAGAIRPSRGKVYTKGRLAYVFQDARLQAVADTVRG
jgi:ATPase subunit of ABC transporter with duplicated ATPase domains